MGYQDSSALIVLWFGGLSDLVYSLVWNLLLLNLHRTDCTSFYEISQFKILARSSRCIFLFVRDDCSRPKFLARLFWGIVRHLL
jgi:hypothetical protein